MTRRAAESRVEKGLNQFPGERVTDHKAPKADQVQIIVLNALVRGKSVMNQACPHARHLVGSDACTNATTADGYAAVHPPASDCTRQRHNKIRIIVIRGHPAVAEINHLMASRAQPFDELFLQFESAMVGGDTEALAYSHQFRWRLNARAFTDGTATSPAWCG